MSTLTQIKHGFTQAWDNLSAGWQHLRENMAHAITKFNPVQRSESAQSIEQQIELKSPRWGLLAAEVSESDDKVVVRLEAPGMESKDFDVDLVENYLVVRGEKRVERNEQQGRYHVMECAYGQFERAIALPAKVTLENSKAKYKNEVLTVTLSKSAPLHNRKIDVKTE